MPLYRIRQRREVETEVYVVAASADEAKDMNNIWVEEGWPPVDSELISNGPPELLSADEASDYGYVEDDE